jgi:hypothetical protein
VPEILVLPSFALDDFGTDDASEGALSLPLVLLKGVKCKADGILVEELLSLTSIDELFPSFDIA